MLLGVSGCRDDGPQLESRVVSAATLVGPEPVARDLGWLMSAMDLVEERAYFSERVDWPGRRLEAEQLAATDPGAAQLGAYLTVVLNDLGDNHSRLLHPLTVEASLSSDAESASRPRGKVVAGKVGYVQLPAFSGASVRGHDGQLEFAVTSGYVSYVEAARTLLSDPAVCGWIVDLRGNTGGNAYPMLAAAFPLLGPGVAVGFEASNGDLSGISLSIDGSPSDAGDVSRVGPLNATDQPVQPVAVLTDRATASAGEMVAVAFRHRPNTRSFGAPTRGIPTGNEAFTLSDGSALYLTTGVSVDRQGGIHDGPIDPDEVASSDRDALAAATTWLQSQCA
jgi:carboxyl-terminal processing protease